MADAGPGDPEFEATCRRARRIRLAWIVYLVLYLPFAFFTLLAPQILSVPLLFAFLLLFFFTADSLGGRWRTRPLILVMLIIALGADGALLEVTFGSRFRLPDPVAEVFVLSVLILPFLSGVLVTSELRSIPRWAARRENSSRATNPR